MQFIACLKNNIVVGKCQQFAHMFAERFDTEGERDEINHSDTML